MAALKLLLKKLRSWYLVHFKYRGIVVGPGFHVAWKVTIHQPGFVAGRDVYIGPYSEISPRVSIGDYSSLSSYVCITGQDHIYDRIGVPIRFSGRPESSETKIGRDVLIGHGATIIRGVSIGNGAVVGAGAVVTRDVEPYSIVGGIPAKHIRYRFTPEEIKKHEDALDSASGFDHAVGKPG
jgi:acetyltransferase-like isoleucine patch superfamily enzyme